MERIINQKHSRCLAPLFGRLVSTLCILLIAMIRPILGPATCKFQETCTPYSIRQFREKSLFHALYAIGKRLIACSPFIK